MLLRNRVRHRETETGALPDFLGREKRIEDLALHVRGDAGAIVTDVERHSSDDTVFP